MFNFAKCPLFNGGNQVNALSQDEAAFERLKQKFQCEENNNQVAFMIGLFQQAIVFYETTASELVDQLIEQLEEYEHRDEFWLANNDVVFRVDITQENPTYYIQLEGIPLDSKVVRISREMIDQGEKLVQEAKALKQELSNLDLNGDFEISVRHSKKDDDNDEDQGLAIVPR